MNSVHGMVVGRRPQLVGSWSAAASARQKKALDNARARGLLIS